MQMLKAIFFVVLMFSGINIFAQGVAINIDGSSADTSAILDVNSATKGLLVPRMTASDRASIILPATGLVVYQTDGTAGFYYNTGTPAVPVWAILLNGSSSLDASNISSGTVNTARLGSGTANSTTFLRGDNTWATSGGAETVSVLTANYLTSLIGFTCINTSFNNWILDMAGNDFSSDYILVQIPAANSVSAGTIFRYTMVNYANNPASIMLFASGTTYYISDHENINFSTNGPAVIGTIPAIDLISDGVTKWFKLR